MQLAALNERLKVLQEQITAIKQAFPFTIEAKIKNEEWVASETTKLREELNQLKIYEQDLTLQYKIIISRL